MTSPVSMPGAATDQAPPKPEISAELVAAHERLQLSVDGDHQDWAAAFDGLAAALDTYVDPNEALDALDSLVTQRLEAGIADARDQTTHEVYEPAARWLRLYLALVEDFYLSIDLPMSASEMRLRRGQLALDLDLLDEAVELLQAAAAALAEIPEIYAGSPWHMLGQALAGQQRTADAIEAFGLAAATSSLQAEPALAAESLDALARLVEEEAPERAVQNYTDAAQQWRLAGDDHEANGSQALAGWAAIQVVAEAYAAGDSARREAFAQLAHDNARDIDEVLEGFAAIQLALLHAERREPTPALPLLRSALKVFERLDDPGMVAMCLALLGVVHTLLADIESADAFVRQAVAMAEQLDDKALVAALLGLLGAAADIRSDFSAAESLFAIAAEHLSELDMSLIRDQERLSALLTQSDLPAARSLAESIVERTMGHADTVHAGVSALGMLVMIHAVTGDALAAERCVQTLEGLYETYRTAGSHSATLGISWIMPVARAFAALARGDLQRFRRLVLQRHDELLREGAGFMAARLAGLVGQVDLHAGDARSAATMLTPAMFGLSRQLSMLPSSAERSALRAQLQLIVEPTFKAVAAGGDAARLAELIEAVRAQGVPDPVDERSAGAQSVASLVGGLLPVRSTGRPDWAEQETTLPIPPFVVMPWGSVAMEGALRAGRRYASGDYANDPVAHVRLIVPR